MIVVISGSRTLTDVALVWKLLDAAFPPPISGQTQFIFGDAAGVDGIAHCWCHIQKVAHDEPIVPNWAFYRKGAGVIRNQEMVARADRGICIGTTAGTLSTVKALITAGKPYLHFNANGVQLNPTLDKFLPRGGDT